MSEVYHEGGGGRFSGYGPEAPSEGVVGASESSLKVDWHSADRFAFEVIARLLIAHRQNTEPRPQTAPSPLVEQRERDSFLRAVTDNEPEVAHEILDVLTDRGIARQVLLLDMIGGTAHELGRLWEEDIVSFVDVTTALCALHQVMRARSWSDNPITASRSDEGNLLLTTLDSEQHILGIGIVGEIFSEAGWRVTVLPGGSFHRVLQCVSQSDFDVLGISMACCSDPANVATDIDVLRRASRRPDLSVIVGGRAVIQSPDLWKEVGADAGIEDAVLAPAIAKGLRKSRKASI